MTHQKLAGCRLFVLLMVLAGVAFSPAALARPRWSEQAAQSWYSKQPWLDEHYAGFPRTDD